MKRHGCLFRPLGARDRRLEDALNDRVRHRNVREPADRPLCVNHLEQRYFLRLHSGNKDTTYSPSTMYNPSEGQVRITERP